MSSSKIPLLGIEAAELRDKCKGWDKGESSMNTHLHR